MKIETPKVDVLEELRAVYELRIKELEEQLKQYEKHSYTYADVQSRLLEANTSFLEVQMLIIKYIGK